MARPWQLLGGVGSVRGDVQDTGSGWTIRLCGPVTVEAAERQGDARLPGRQGRLLLAYLAINRDRPCSRGELIDLLWPEAPPAAADTALSALLSKLRRVLGSGALAGRSNVRLVAPGAVTVDVEEAARAARRAEAALQDGAWRPAETAARQALTADPAAFLPDCDGSWVRDQRASLEVLRVRALEMLAEACLRAGELGEAEDAARAAVAAAPFRESSHRLLMEVHEAAGNPAEALRVFEDLRRLLREELGTAPGPAAMAVHERMLRGGAPAVRRPAPLPGTAPVGPGARRWPVPLEALRSRHAFVGRADEAAFLESCWRRAAAGTRGLVVLAGDAGIGKTRLAAELAPPRARRRRARALRALRRGRSGALQARGGAAARMGRRRVARARGRAARRARRRPRDRPPGAGPGAGRARGRRRAAADRGGRRAPPAALRRARRAAGRDRRRGAAARGARRHPLGRPPHAPADRPPRAGARAGAGAVRGHDARRGDRRAARPPARRAAPRGDAAAARARRARRARDRRARRRARRPARGRRLPRHAARRDRGEPVLHRGGGPAPRRPRGSAGRRRRAARGGRARGRARDHRSPAGAAVGPGAPGAGHRGRDRARVRLRRAGDHRPGGG